MNRATLLFVLLCCAACGAGLVDHDGVDVNALTSACAGACPSPQNATGVCNADTKTCDFACNAGFFRCASQAACCPATGLAAGGETSCAVVDGTVQCWGANDSGQLGFDPTGAMWSAKPVNVPGITAASAVAVGLRHACAIVGNGDVWCWGANESGQLANVTGPAPGQVSGVSGAIMLAAGDRHTCAAIMGGSPPASSVVCWGANESGQLGRGTTSVKELPGPVTGLSDVASLSAGAAFSCGAATSGGFPNLYCWGDGSSGQLGNGPASPAPAPYVAPGVGSASVLACGSSHACAIGSKLSCWGNDDSGQVGDGHSGPGVTATVTGISAVPSPVGIAAGLGHTCAVSSSGDAYCWGANAFSQLGNGNTLGLTRPPQTPVLSGVQRIAAGSRHTCAQVATGGVYCWGNNSKGQAGAPLGGTIAVPGLIAGR